MTVDVHIYSHAEPGERQHVEVGCWCQPQIVGVSAGKNTRRVARGAVFIHTGQIRPAVKASLDHEADGVAMPPITRGHVGGSNKGLGS